MRIESMDTPIPSLRTKRSHVRIPQGKPSVKESHAKHILSVSPSATRIPEVHEVTWKEAPRIVKGKKPHRIDRSRGLLGGKLDNQVPSRTQDSPPGLRCVPRIERVVECIAEHHPKLLTPFRRQLIEGTNPYVRPSTERI